MQSKDTDPHSLTRWTEHLSRICRTVFQGTQALLLLPFMQTNAHFQDVFLTVLPLNHNWKNKKEFKVTPLLPHPRSLHLAVTTRPFSLSSAVSMALVDEEHEEISTKLVGLPHLVPGVWVRGSWNSSTEDRGGLPSSGKVDATFCLLHGGCVSFGECGFSSFIFCAKSLFAAWALAPWLQKKCLLERVAYSPPAADAAIDCFSLPASLSDLNKGFEKQSKLIRSSCPGVFSHYAWRPTSWKERIYEALTEDILPFQTERCIREQCWLFHRWDWPVLLPDSSSAGDARGIRNSTPSHKAFQR